MQLVVEILVHARAMISRNGIGRHHIKKNYIVDTVTGVTYIYYGVHSIYYVNGEYYHNIEACD